nr:hypothetical protein [Desulfobacterales bacterium]
MTEIVEEQGRKRDHYRATLENDSLVLQPYCACGNLLGEDYFCDKCNKRCHCNEIICDNQATLELVRKYKRSSPKFSMFNVRLATESEQP